MKRVKEKRMHLLISSIVLFVSILSIIIISTVFFPNQEKKLTKELIKLGNEYYSDYWYPYQTKDKDDTQIKADLSKYTTSGIKVNLDSLNNTFRNEKDIMKTFKYKNKTCNKAETYIYFYPEEPFDSKSVKIEAYLSCDFLKK